MSDKDRLLGGLSAALERYITLTVERDEARAEIVLLQGVISKLTMQRDEALELLRECRKAFDWSLNGYWSRELGELLARLDALLGGHDE